MPYPLSPVPTWLQRHIDSFLLLLVRESKFSARGKTLLVIDRPAFSIFHKRSQDIFEDRPPIDDLPFQFNLEDEKFTDLKVVASFEKFFCQALSLACNSAVQISGTGLLFAEEKFFHPDNGGVSLSRFPGRFEDATKVGKTEIDEAKCLYRQLINLASSDREKLQIPFDRWIQSRTRQNPIDKIIDLGIVLEAFYVTGNKITKQLYYRAPTYLGAPDEEKQKTLETEFEAIYDYRSAIVHNKELKENVQVSEPFVSASELIARAQVLCRKSIMKVLDEGKFPNWDTLRQGRKEQISS